MPRVNSATASEFLIIWSNGIFLSVRAETAIFSVPPLHIPTAFKRWEQEINFFGTGQKWTISISASRIASSNPVSYTHLDVYKRQASCLPLLQLFSFSCSSPSMFFCNLLFALPIFIPYFFYGEKFLLQKRRQESRKLFFRPYDKPSLIIDLSCHMGTLCHIVFKCPLQPLHLSLIHISAERSAEDVLAAGYTHGIQPMAAI